MTSLLLVFLAANRVGLRVYVAGYVLRASWMLDGWVQSHLFDYRIHVGMWGPLPVVGCVYGFFLLFRHSFSGTYYLKFAWDKSRSVGKGLLLHVVLSSIVHGIKFCIIRIKSMYVACMWKAEWMEATKRSK